jgi:invasion protein IalB
MFVVGTRIGPTFLMPFCWPINCRSQGLTLTGKPRPRIAGSAAVRATVLSKLDPNRIATNASRINLLPAIAMALFVVLAQAPPESSAQERHGGLLLAQAPAPSASQPADQSTVTIGDWVHRCVGVNGDASQRVCEIYQQVQAVQPGGRVTTLLSIAIGYPAPQQPPMITVLIPVNVSLGVQPALIAKGLAAIPLRFVHCAVNACVARAEASETLVQLGEKPDAEMRLEFRSAADAVVSVPLSMNGFGQAFAALLAVPMPENREEQAAPAATPKGLAALKDPQERLKGPASEEVRAALAAWRLAWESRDVDDYMRFYHPNFVGRENFERQRKSAMTRARTIRVALEDIQVTEESGRVRVVFLQTYRSDTYQSQDIKSQVWVSGSQGPQILSEVVQARRNPAAQ